MSNDMVSKQMSNDMVECRTCIFHLDHCRMPPNQIYLKITLLQTQTNVLPIHVKMVPTVQMASMNFPVNVWKDMKGQDVK